MNDYEKIIGQGNDGDFVRNLRGSTGTGFQDGWHVHKDWYAKTMSYEQGLEKLEQGVAEREDILTKMYNIETGINKNDQFIIRVEDRDFIPTPHALKQLGVSVDVSTFYLESMRNNPVKANGTEKFQRDRQDAEILADVVDNAFRRVDSNKVCRLRTYQDGTLRAWLSEKYAPIDNRWYMEVLSEVIPGGRLSHWKGDADTIYGNILIPDTLRQEEDSDYGGMISIGNCEIGTRRISQLPSLFRSICMNGCIWDQTFGKNISKVHRGTIDLVLLRKQVFDNIEQQIPLLPAGLDQLLDLRTMGTDGVSMKGVIGAVCLDSKLNQKQSTSVLTNWVQHEKQDRNLFGVVNAVTRTGQELNNTDWVKFDELGGRLMSYTDTQWDRMKRRAESFDDKEIEKIFVTV